MSFSTGSLPALLVKRTLAPQQAWQYLRQSAAAIQTAQAASSLQTSAARRVLGLDVGDRFVGVAVSDSSNRLALPATTIHRLRPGAWRPHSPNFVSRGGLKLAGASSDSRGWRPMEVVPPADVARALAAEVKRHQALLLVIGHPLTMDGKVDAQTRKVYAFVEQMLGEFERAGREKPAIAPSGTTTAPSPDVRLAWWDERLSTAEIRGDMDASGYDRRDRAREKRVIDQMAARSILQDYLDHLYHQFGADDAAIADSDSASASSERSHGKSLPIRKSDQTDDALLNRDDPLLQPPR